MEKCLIVAVADNGAIGVGGDLPWHISEDLKFFKATTMGCPVIMGRKTYQSIGRPLPGRLNIVLTHNPEPIEGVAVVDSMEKAYEAAADAPKIFVMGGAAVYKSVISDMDTLYVTHVHTSIENADAFFPEIDSKLWAVKSRSQMYLDPKSGYEFEFVVYERNIR